MFEDELIALHQMGFVHRNIKRPSGLSGWQYDNIFLMQTGIRLIDVGISALHSQVGDKLFSRYVSIEMEELQEFREFFINR